MGWVLILNLLYLFNAKLQVFVHTTTQRLTKQPLPLGGLVTVTSPHMHLLLSIASHFCHQLSAAALW
jgi:hypothetical protein